MFFFRCFFLFEGEKKPGKKSRKKRNYLSKGKKLSLLRTMWHPTTSSVAESTIIFMSVLSFLPESVFRMGLNLETKTSNEGEGDEEAFPLPSSPSFAASTRAATSSSVRPQDASGGWTKHAVGTLS